MAKKMLIDATQPEEVRVAIVQGNKVEEFEFESTLRKQLKGNIYLAKVTRIEPSLQAAFVDYGGNRHGFLPLSEIHPDYYQIPQEDRDALLADEAREAEEAQAAEDADEAAEDEAAAEKKEDKPKKPRRTRRKKKVEAEAEAEAEAEESEGETATEENSNDGEPKVEAAAEDTPAEETEPKPEEAAEEQQPAEEATPENSTETAEEVSEENAEEPEGTTKAADSKDERIEGPAEDEAGEAEVAEVEAAADPSENTLEEAAAETESPAAEEETKSDGEEENVEAAEADGEEKAEGEGSDEETAQPRKRTRRRGGRGRRRKKAQDENTAEETENGDAEEGETVETAEEVGGEDGDEDAALVARRRARRRQYRIQEVIKPRQILLVQVVKEERGNKGAALTTYLSLAGRYGVLMPNTARGGGISRKINNAADRKRLKGVVRDLDVSKGMGLIVRTAGAQRTKAEIKRDYDYLMRLWENIRELTLKSVAPCLIYEEGSLIMRTIRDLYSKEVEAILVEGEDAYKEAKGYMKMLMPSHAKNVQQYKDPVPLFQRYQVEAQLEQMIDPEVQLKSGGYLVINPTEALVSIDINSGRSTKEKNVEQTALRTNLEAAEEISRQLKMRDLAGLIVIDFIDMDEHRNNRAVEKRLKECLKGDRARIQVGRISQFGLLEMSRQRLGSSLLETATRTCPHCKGSGLLRTDDSAALSALRRIEEEAMRGKASEITVSLHPDITLYLLNHKRQQIADIEQRHDIRVILAADSKRRVGVCEIERTKTRKDVRRDAAAKANDTAISAVQIDDMAEADAASAETETDSSDDGGEEQPKKRRRGRRGGRKRGKQAQANENADTENDENADGIVEGEGEAKLDTAADAETAKAAEADVDETAQPIADAEEAPADKVEDISEAPAEPAAEPVVEQAAAEESEVEPEEEKRVIPPVSEQEDPNKPKKKGWWSRVRGE